MVDSEKPQIPEEHGSKLRSIIAQEDWIFAKSYAKTAPHEYCLHEDKKRGNVPAADILFFAQCILEYGYQEYFYSYLQTYTDVDGYKYWYMERTAEEVDLINRAPLTEDGIAELCRKNIVNN